MSRWRDIKQEKNSSIKLNNKVLIIDSCASIPSRIKAFIVDMFMIMMPLAYVTTYILLDGKDDFQNNDSARWAISIIYGLVIIFFWVLKAQSPGLKAYKLKLIDNKTKNNISVAKAVLRYFAFLFSAMTIVLTLLPFFRKDKKTFQDLIANTLVIDN